MRTTSLTRRKGVLPPPSTLVLMGFVVVAVGVVLLFREPLGGLFWRLFTPVIAARNALDAREITRLKTEITSKDALLADRALLLEENLELKSRLGRNAGREVLLAGVLMRPPATPYDTLLIDVGEAQGAVSGQVVSAGGTTLIGEIREVYRDTARVVLFSAPGEKQEALLYRGEASSVPLELEGIGGGGFSAKVPAGTHAKTGEAVVLLGIAGGVFGSVSAIEVREGESFETLYVHLPINLFSLRFVEVWRTAAQ